MALMGHATSYLKNIFRFNYLSIRIQKKKNKKKTKKKQDNCQGQIFQILHLSEPKCFSRNFVSMVEISGGKLRQLRY